LTKKEELYYLLKAFKRGEYDVILFCDVFEDIFYPDVPVDELSAFELEKFKDLAKIVVRFSQYEEDHKLCPNAFRTVEEVNAAIDIAYSALVEDGTEL